ncbi:MAG: ComEC/Rec2 family competence protein [Candidatus Omnitrophota bacterium]
MKNSLAFLVVCFCSGIVFAYLFRINFWLVYFLGFIVVAISIKLGNGSIFPLFRSSSKNRTASLVLLFISVFILGALHFKNSCVVSKSCVSRFIYYKDDTIYTLKGFINNNPVIKDSRVIFILKAEELEFNKSRYKSCGDILVYFNGAIDLSYGDELILLGNIHRPYKMFRDDISAVMHLQNNSALVRLNKNKGSLIKRLAFYLKDKIEVVFLKRLSPLAAGIVDAMVLGEKKHISPVVYDAMIKSGTVHILVVSGFNVGIVAFMSGLFFKILRIPRKPRYILVIVCLILYCFITGVSTPVVRATVMGIFFILGYFFQREPDISNSLSLAVLFILINNPKDIFSISFQLSFISVLAIVYLYPKFKSLFRIEEVKIKFLKFILEGFSVSFSAWLGTVGFIAYYFKIISPVTVLANIFIVPMATLITLSGLSMVIISMVLPWLAGPFASTNEILVITLLQANSWFINLPFAYLYL